MLPRNNRLTRTRDFEILFEQGRMVHGNLVLAKVWKIDPTKYPKRGYATTDLKIGFVVGLKIHKSAVQRNRVKRQMREVVRLLLKENKINSGYMISIMAKKEILQKEYKDIESDILLVLKRARVI